MFSLSRIVRGGDQASFFQTENLSAGVPDSVGSIQLRYISPAGPATRFGWPLSCAAGEGMSRKANAATGADSLGWQPAASKAAAAASASLEIAIRFFIVAP